MAVIQLRLPANLADDPVVVLGVAYLEGDRYRLTFRWSPRDADEGAWRVDVADSTGTVQVAGIPLHVCDDILEPFRYPSLRIPPGKLRVTAVVDPLTPYRRDDPGLRSLGRTAQVEYVEVGTVEG